MWPAIRRTIPSALLFSKVVQLLEFITHTLAFSAHTSILYVKSKNAIILIKQRSPPWSRSTVLKFPMRFTSFSHIYFVDIYVAFDDYIMWVIR